MGNFYPEVTKTKKNFSDGFDAFSFSVIYDINTFAQALQQHRHLNFRNHGLN